VDFWFPKLKKKTKKTSSVTQIIIINKILV